jgi:hypothetical protein
MEEDRFEEMYDYEDGSDCVDGKRYLGTTLLPSKDTSHQWLLEYRLSMDIFYSFPIDDVIAFSCGYPSTFYLKPQLEILHVVMRNDVYTVVIKTYWLRIVQRAWKRLMKQRAEWLQNIKKNVLKIVGFPMGYQRPSWPSCRGLLTR